MSRQEIVVNGKHNKPLSESAMGDDHTFEGNGNNNKDGETIYQ